MFTPDQVVRWFYLLPIGVMVVGWLVMYRISKQKINSEVRLLESHLSERLTHALAAYDVNQNSQASTGASTRFRPDLLSPAVAAVHVSESAGTPEPAAVIAGAVVSLLSARGRDLEPDSMIRIRAAGALPVRPQSNGVWTQQGRALIQIGHNHVYQRPVHNVTHVAGVPVRPEYAAEARSEAAD